MLAKIEQNNALVMVSDNLAELVGLWSEELERRKAAGELSAVTVATYRRGVKRFVAWAGADGVSARSIEGWKRSMLEDGRKAAGVNVFLAGVRDLFSWATVEGYIPVNPAASVKGAKRRGSNKHTREALSALEVRRVLAAVDRSTAAGKRDYAILCLMVYTAVRSVEVLRADLADLRYENGQMVLYIQGKGHSTADDLVVIASSAAQEAIHDWLTVRGKAAGALFVSFSNRSAGGRLSARALRGLVIGYFKAAGVVGNKSTHSLRHTAITAALRGGATVNQVKGMSRHASLDTLSIYAHELDRLANPAEAAIDYGE